MNERERKRSERKKKHTRDNGGRWSSSRSISWESLSKRLWSSPRSSVTHCLRYRIRFSTGRTSLQAPVRLGWLVSARRRPRCNAWMRFPSTHVYTHTYTHIYINARTDLRDCDTELSRSSALLVPLSIRSSVFVQLCNESAGVFLPVSFAIQSFPPTIYDRQLLRPFSFEEKQIFRPFAAFFIPLRWFDPVLNPPLGFSSNRASVSVVFTFPTVLQLRCF